jgi:hypothetical protein
VPHGKQVVDTLRGAEGVAEFVRGWRRHFVRTLEPRFLSEHWSVDARVANSTASVFGGKARALEASQSGWAPGALTVVQSAGDGGALKAPASSAGGAGDDTSD